MVAENLKLRLLTSPIPQLPWHRMLPPSQIQTPISAIQMAHVQRTPMSTMMEGSASAIAIGSGDNAKEAAFALKQMSDSLKPLREAFDAMGRQVAHIALIGGDEKVHKVLTQYREKMAKQKEKQDAGIHEIKLILDDVVKNQINQYLQDQIEKEIGEQVEKQVQELVKEQLEKIIPTALQEEFIQSKKELEELRRELHNSESRRYNGALKPKHPQALLYTILTVDGKVSPAFPKDLQSLFDLDDAKAKQLVIDYGLPDGPSKSGQTNVNRFMYFIGVAHQLDRSPDHSGEFRLLSPVAMNGKRK